MGLNSDLTFVKLLKKVKNMSIKVYELNDSGFYGCINGERKPYRELSGLVITEGFIPNTAVQPVWYFEKIREMVQNGLVPKMRITRALKVNEHTWYNKHVGELYELHRYVIDTRNGFVGYIVKSGDDGTIGGYHLPGEEPLFGKGYDYVRSSCCECVFHVVSW